HQSARRRTASLATNDEPTMSESQEAARPPPPRLDDPVETAAQAPQAKGWAPQRNGRLLTAVFAAILVAGALLALYAWGLPPFSRNVQSTDNAYVHGQTTVIAPQVSGYVTEVLVQDFARVKRGQALVRIDDRVYRQR